MDGKQIEQDPMRMPSWSIGMACVWIACRDPVAAETLWSRNFEDVWLTLDDDAIDPALNWAQFTGSPNEAAAPFPDWVAIDERPNEAVQAARDDLRFAMIEGAVKATGLLADGSGRTEISAIEWEDMIWSYDLGDDGLVHRACNKRDEIYTDILVARDDVLKRWPADQAKLTSGDEKRAIQEAAAILLTDNDIKKPDLEKQLRGRGLNFSANAFKNRIWRQARNQAHLPPGGRAGRRSSNNR